MFVPVKSEVTYPIPTKLNIGLALLFGVLTLVLWTIPVVWPGIVPLLLAGACFGLLYQSIYALIHEAMHRMFSNNKFINDLFGIIGGIYLFSSFRLLRYFHRDHHVKNRGAHELIEYHQGSNRVSRTIRYYVILVGLNWFSIVLVNILFSFIPIKTARRYKIDKVYGGPLASLPDRELRIIFLEHMFTLAVHVLILMFTPVTFIQYLVFFGFTGFFFSQIRYVYHYRSPVSVRDGSYNLTGHSFLHWFLLNETFHLIHHHKPRVPWIHLSKFKNVPTVERPFLTQLLSQWKGTSHESTRIASHE